MSNIKAHFKSRWGDDGVIVEADFSQLEVIGAAEISNDPMMKKDIRDGIDSHSQSASWLNPESYEEIRAGYLAGDTKFVKMRKNAKAPRFELQYGAGASSIARNNNLTQKVAQGFIDNYYSRYNVLKAFQDSVEKKVKKSRTPTSKVSAGGYTIGKGVYQNPTGRLFTFHEYDAPEWMHRRGVYTSFSPTQIKNYPMQSFATGDIVPMMCGEVLRMLHADDTLRDNCLMINTIHDSIIFDCKKEVLDYAAFNIKGTMEQVPWFMQEWFGIDLELPFHVDVEYGNTWLELETWDG